jgi:curli biogenesis system outer membrane secretion channel CsgG
MRKIRTRFRLEILALSGILLLFLCPGARAAEKRLAVMKFTTTAGSGGSYWHSASWDLGDGMAEMLTTALVETGKFRVLERQQIHDVLGEQDLGASGRVDPDTAAKIGKILGARYLVYGTVDEFEYSRGGEGGGVRIGGFRVGGSEAQAHIGMDVRIVDAVTSEILFSTRSTAEATRTGFRVGYSGADFGADLATFQKTPLGEATRKAIDNAVAKMVSQFGTEAAPEPAPAWSGTLFVADDGTLVIKAGSHDGLKAGDVLVVYRARTTKVGNEVLTVGQDKIGTIRLVSVGESASSAEAVEGSGFQTGDIVKTGGRP